MIGKWPVLHVSYSWHEIYENYLFMRGSQEKSPDSAPPLFEEHGNTSGGLASLEQPLEDPDLLNNPPRLGTDSDEDLHDLFERPDKRPREEMERID